MEFIVGTALAGIPIVLEAYEYYWKVSDGFRTFRQYPSELSKIDTIMRTQMTLFRGNVVRVLTVLSDDPKLAEEILSNVRSVVLEELELPNDQVNSRSDLLRGMFASWEATLKLVRDSILVISREIKGLRPETPKTEHSASKEIIKDILNRFRLSWRKGTVQNSIKELRSFTADFNELTTRIVDNVRDLRNKGRPNQRREHRPTLLNQDSLNKYRQIRAASYNLYDIFTQRWVCTRHHKHALNVSLAGNESPTQADPTQRCIRFKVAVDCACGYSSCQDTPVWVDVEALETISTNRQDDLGDQLTDKIPELGTRNALATMIENITPYSRPLVVGRSAKFQQKPVGKRVPSTSALSATAANPTPMTVNKASTSVVNSTSMVNLEDIQDHCGHFGTRTTQSAIPSYYVGLIKEPNLHRFHMPPPERQLPSQQKSLEELISWVSEDDFTRNLPRTSIVHLAYSLATAVLQYHSTPWLPDAWKSSHVRLFSLNELTQPTNGTLSYTPYLRVEFSGQDKGKAKLQATGLTPHTSKDTTYKSMALARNAVLFCLGIMLLELGYSKPWIQLREWAFQSLPVDKQTDYHAAERLAQAPGLRNRMGPRFTTIVRKCLGCDFGLGEKDLANEQLQGVFLVDVILALKEVERGLIELEKRIGGW